MSGAEKSRVLAYHQSFLHTSQRHEPVGRCPELEHSTEVKNLFNAYFVFDEYGSTLLCSTKKSAPLDAAQPRLLLVSVHQ